MDNLFPANRECINWSCMGIYFSNLCCSSLAPPDLMSDLAGRSNKTLIHQHIDYACPYYSYVSTPRILVSLG